MLWAHAKRIIQISNKSSSFHLAFGVVSLINYYDITSKATQTVQRLKSIFPQAAENKAYAKCNIIKEICFFKQRSTLKILLSTERSTNLSDGVGTQSLRIHCLKNQTWSYLPDSWINREVVIGLVRASCSGYRSRMVCTVKNTLPVYSLKEEQSSHSPWNTWWGLFTTLQWHR